MTSLKTLTLYCYCLTPKILFHTYYPLSTATLSLLTFITLTCAHWTSISSLASISITKHCYSMFRLFSPSVQDILKIYPKTMALTKNLSLSSSTHNFYLLVITCGKPSSIVKGIMHYKRTLWQGWCFLLATHLDRHQNLHINRKIMMTVQFIWILKWFKQFGGLDWLK